MLSLLLAKQAGLPMGAWIVIGVILAIVLLILALKSFWVSKTIATIFNIIAIVICIKAMVDSMDMLGACILAGTSLTISWLFMAGNDAFDSHTEGDYLILGTLVHESNHPVSAFFGTIAAFAFLFVLIFWAAYAWTMIIGLVVAALSLILSVAVIIERIRG